MLRDMCETIYEKRERVLVFTQFKEITPYLEEFLSEIFHCHVNPLKNRMDYQVNMVNKMRQKAFYLNYVFIDEDTVLCVDPSDEIVRLKGDEKLAVEYGDKTIVFTVDDLRTETVVKQLK